MCLLKGRLNKIPIKFVPLPKWQHFSENSTVLFDGLIKARPSSSEECDGLR
jgi:hypothetical protein